jgi:hypothetical protein
MGRYLDKYLTCDLNVCKIGRHYANVSSFTLSVVIFEDLVTLELLSVSVSAPCTCVGVHSVMVFFSNK